MRYVAILLLGLPLWSQTVVKRHAAGSDAEGNRLTVVEKRYPKRAASETRCVPDEQYVLEKAWGGKVVSSEAVVTICRRDDDIENDVTVAPNSITVARDGGLHAGFNRGETFQLSPWQPVDTDVCSLYGSGEFTTEHFDLRKLRHQAWHEPGPSEEYPEGVAICGDSPKLFTYLVVPRVAFDAAQLEQAHARLGSCALGMDASGNNGFVTWGKPDAHDPVEVKLLRTGEHTLVAQAIDPQRSTRPASSWVNADHWEVWMDLGSVWQFGIPLDDSPVQVGYGKPPRLPVVRRWTSTLPDGRTAVVLKIELPPVTDPSVDRLTVVYSQSLEGRAQKRMIATSRVQRGESETIGWNGSTLIHNSAADYVTCGLVGGALEITGAARKPIEVPPPLRDSHE